MGYVAKSPATGRPSITAAISLSMAYREDRLEHVADTWQTIAALPHALIIDTKKCAAYLVLQSAKYAMCVWQATVVSVPQPITGSGVGKCDGGGGVDSRRWIFNRAARWEWMSVWNVQEWLYQPTKWCTLMDCHDVAPPESFVFWVVVRQGMPYHCWRRRWLGRGGRA